MAFHKSLDTGDIHIVCNWEYADAATRTGASGFVAADVGKFALQLDDNTVWILTAITPTWVAISGSATSLNSISDVTITAVSDNEILSYDTGKWINQTPDEADVIDKTTAQSLTNKAISTGSTVLGADDLPNTITNILSDHDKAAHDALGIDADTIDGIDSTGLSLSGHTHLWADINKATSSLADITTRSAGALSSGNLDIARLPTGGEWDLSASVLGIKGNNVEQMYQLNIPQLIWF